MLAQITELTKNGRLLGSWLNVDGAVVPDDNYYEDEDCGSHNFRGDIRCGGEQFPPVRLVRLSLWDLAHPGTLRVVVILRLFHLG